MTRAFFCDRCKTDIAEHQADGWVRFDWMPIGKPVAVTCTVDLPDGMAHLCSECSQSLCRWLKQEVVA